MKKILLVLVFLAALTAIAGVLTGIFFPERLSAPQPAGSRAAARS